MECKGELPGNQGSGIMHRIKIIVIAALHIGATGIEVECRKFDSQ